MKQIIYAMQFKGKAAPGASQNVMKAATSASSKTITTVIGADGVQGNFEPAAGGKAQFESEVTLTGETSFLEKGTIRFGDRNIVCTSAPSSTAISATAQTRSSSRAP